MFKIIERKVPIPLDDATAVDHSIKGDIKFNKVNFFYPKRPDAPVIRDFTHEFKRGTTTAIVGPSGSGKSTLVQLIERFYDAQGGEKDGEGVITFDGVPLKAIKL